MVYSETFLALVKLTTVYGKFTFTLHDFGKLQCNLIESTTWATVDEIVRTVYPLQTNKRACSILQCLEFLLHQGADVSLIHYNYIDSNPLSVIAPQKHIH